MLRVFLRAHLASPGCEIVCALWADGDRRRAKVEVAEGFDLLGDESVDGPATGRRPVSTTVTPGERYKGIDHDGFVFSGKVDKVGERHVISECHDQDYQHRTCLVMLLIWLVSNF